MNEDELSGMTFDMKTGGSLSYDADHPQVKLLKYHSPSNRNMTQVISNRSKQWSDM